MTNKPSYSYVDAEIFAKDKAEGEDIFLKLNEGQFKDWVVQITKIEVNDDEINEEICNMRMEYVVLKVPKNVKDEQVTESKPKLDIVLGNVLNDILKEAISLVG